QRPLNSSVRHLMTRVVYFSMFLALSSSAFACKCLDQSLSEEFERASGVFVGSTHSSPSPDESEASGATISFVVSRSLKGAPPVGSSVTINPLFGTDCTAPFIPETQLLVFAFSQSSGAPVAAACSVQAAEAFSVGGKSYQPS